MTVYGPLIGRKQIGEVKKNSKESFQKKVMVWSESVALLALFEKCTLNHHRYIKKVLPVALRYGNSKFGTFQQDNETPHTHQKTQDWCSQHFPSFIGKDTWPANSPDLNPAFGTNSLRSSTGIK